MGGIIVDNAYNVLVDTGTVFLNGITQTILSDGKSFQMDISVLDEVTVSVINPYNYLCAINAEDDQNIEIICTPGTTI